jgi:hypothetical protein
LPTNNDHPTSDPLPQLRKLSLQSHPGVAASSGLL